jgi:hypothetical protein
MKITIYHPHAVYPCYGVTEYECTIDGEYIVFPSGVKQPKSKLGGCQRPYIFSNKEDALRFIGGK